MRYAEYFEVERREPMGPTSYGWPLTQLHAGKLVLTMHKHGLGLQDNLSKAQRGHINFIRCFWRSRLPRGTCGAVPCAPKTKGTAWRAIRKYVQFAPRSSTSSSSLRSVQVTTHWDPLLSILYRLGLPSVPFSFWSVSSPSSLLLLLLRIPSIR